jgi:hypothetical protein
MAVIVGKLVCLDLSRIKHGMPPGKRWDLVRDLLGKAKSASVPDGMISG